MKIIFSNPNIVKVPWEILSPEIDKLYAKEFDPKQSALISEHCEFIVEYLHSCGWDEEEYIRRLFKTEESKLN